MRPVAVKHWLTILPALALSVGLCAGCTKGPEAGGEAKAEEIRSIPVTVAAAELRRVERTIPVTGTLKGWEQVAIGSKKTGRVIKVLHDMGDRVAPGEILVELEKVDAEMAVSQAESQYLAELVKLGISRQQAEDFVTRYGISEDLLRGELADQAIRNVPAVVERQVAMEKAATDLNRKRALYQRGVGSKEELQNDEDAYRTAQAAYEDAIVVARTVVANAMTSRVALDVAKQNLADMTIITPTPTMPAGAPAGEIQYAITERPVAEGQMLQPGAELMSLVVENPLRLWVKAPERYVGQIKEGQSTRIKIAAYAGQTFEGVVSRINPSIDEASRTFQVEVSVPNDEGKLRPGGFAEAEIIIDQDDQALVVPLEAIAELAGVTKLFVVENGVARSVSVEKGVEGPGWVEVLGDLKPGDTVVTTGQVQLALLADGTPVTVRQPESEKPAKAVAEEPAAAE